MRTVPQPRLIAAAGASLALLAAVLAVALAAGGDGAPQHARRAAAARPALIGGVPLQRARCAQ